MQFLTWQKLSQNKVKIAKIAKLSALKLIVSRKLSGYFVPNKKNLEILTVIFDYRPLFQFIVTKKGFFSIFFLKWARVKSTKYRFKISPTRRDMKISLFKSIADMPRRNCKKQYDYEINKFVTQQFISMAPLKASLGLKKSFMSERQEARRKTKTTKNLRKNNRVSVMRTKYFFTLLITHRK